MDRNIESLIYKVLGHTATDSERAAVSAWRSLSTQNEDEFESYKILLETEREPSAPSMELERSRTELMTIIYSLEAKRRNIIRFRRVVSILLFALTILVSVWNIINEINPATTAIHFQDSSLSEVADVLSKDWDVMLTTTDPELQKCRLSGHIIYGSDGEEVARTLLNALNLTYSIESPGHFLISGTCGD